MDKVTLLKIDSDKISCSFSLPAATYKEFKQYAKRRKVIASRLLALIIQEFLERESKTPPDFAA